VARVRTYGDVLAAYVTHLEAKSLGPDGHQTGRNTSGVLRRRPVEGILPLHVIGKEGNRLDDRVSGLVTRPEEYRTEYVDARATAWQVLVVPVLKTINRRVLIEFAGLHRRSATCSRV
jgi:hypothetical protein